MKSNRRKISIVIPVYFNFENLDPLYSDLCAKVLSCEDYEFELVMVDDGSGDKSYEKLKELQKCDKRIKIIKLSKNFGSHAAILCGLSNSTGDCVVVKAADLQEPSELILEMVHSWEQGNNVVLATRNTRNDEKFSSLFSNFYYYITRKLALGNMPKKGFDIYLLDKKVVKVLEQMDEPNSALTGQILWVGFKTECVGYDRQAREIGESKWTFRKKISLVKDTLFNFTNVPIKMVSIIGFMCFTGSFIWSVFVLVNKIFGNISTDGFTTLFIFNLASFGVTMLTLGILGEYLWRTFNTSKNRPVYIVDEISDKDKNND